ncbi:MAG: transglycosylase SLT domain-containing protein [Bdellovibrionales bacterium]|nr:transglycosylase SLT domain-containing protein [Bdellovibrionales bacterium]
MKIVIKEKFEKDYISREAGEKLRNEIVSAIKNEEDIILDFIDLVIASTSFFDESIAKLVNEDIGPEKFNEYVTIKDLNKNDQKVLDQVTNYRGFHLHEQKHPWRICPTGEHWVNEHPRNTIKGETSVEGHCRKNTKNKDVVKAEELIRIAKLHFNKIKILPSKNDLEFPRGNEFDFVIAGWCQYWNEILRPELEIHPNIVKALIATESGFEPEPKVTKAHKAIGIMQLMPETLKYLSPSGKELKNHFLYIDIEEAKDPITNISSGVRWLFRKYELTKHKLKRSPTWEEVLLDYKGVLIDQSPKAKQIKSSIEKYLRELK